ncbi:unnamed protein product [Larinioides sclopetarius]|uniref:Uncharacterized protein n=1 Tax=Larinioides sclopetarius TaxID=280406 RepID=A0AAV1ZTB0_9ARAC
MLKLGSMHCLVLVLWTLPTVLPTCVFPSDDAKPKGLEERAIDSEVVLAAYTRTVYKQRNSSSNSYSAEFLVFNIIKGEDRVMEIYEKRKPSSLETALNRRLVNVSNFGDPSKCESDVNPGETYILLLDVLANGELSARYDGAYGPAVVYTRDKETALEAIGSSPWGEWSPCSGSCGGGIQQRRRQCDGSGKCSNEEGQQRTCNMFPCTGILNILEVAGIHRSALRPAGRPTAYKLLPSGSWRSEKEKIVFPRTFPWEFSLLVTVRVKKSFSGGFLLRVLHSESLQVGLYISDILTLVLSEKNNIRASFIKSLFDDHWHQLAFSVRRDTVSFYLNCEYSGKLPLPSKIRPFGGQPATVIVGSTGEHELDAFQGDIEQLTITGSPDAAEKQCNSTTQPLNLRGHAYTLRQEARSRPFSTLGTQNDQLPLRGDIVDDEDFNFDEPGSGSDLEDDDYDDEESDESPKKLDKIPLKSESSDDDEFIEEDEDIKEMKMNFGKEENIVNKDDDYIVDNYEKDDIDIEVDEQTENEEVKDSEKPKFDYDHPDEEPDQDDEISRIEGSGTGSQIELAWSEWSPCSSTCNWGRRTRTSYCLDNGVNLESCAEASSKRSETEACFVRLCPTTSTTLTTPTTTDLMVTTPMPVHNNSVVAVTKKKECRVACRNGGTCHPPYKCTCPLGVYGSLCQYGKCETGVQSKL